MRIVSALLGLLLLWSSFGAAEPPALALPMPHEPVATAWPTPAGSVAEHHLDDQPAQAASPAPADLPDRAPDLMPAPARLALAVPAALWAPIGAKRIAPAPYLDEPLPPPRG